MVVRAGYLAGLAMMIIASSCTPGVPTPSPTATPSSRGGATYLQLIEAEDAQTLDPALVDDPTSLAIGSEIFEGLTRLDSSQRPVAGLADRWHVGDAGKTYTCHLRAARYQSGVTDPARDAVTS